MFVLFSFSYHNFFVFVNLSRKSKLKLNCSLIAIEFVRYIVYSTYNRLH